MALTQTARMAGPGVGGRGPSWDEEVVPALRKRLESESRTLAKRISSSGVSLSESAEDQVRTSSSIHHGYGHGDSDSTSRSRMGGSRQADGGASTTKRPSNTRTPSNGSANNPRSRTVSQPYNNVHTQSNSSAPYSTSSSSSGGGPYTNSQSSHYNHSQSRIPLPQQRARSRAGSVSSSSQSQSQSQGQSILQQKSPRTRTPTPGDSSAAAADLWVVHEQRGASASASPLASALASASASRSTVSIHDSHQSHNNPARQNGLLRSEPAPFNPGSASSSNSAIHGDISSSQYHRDDDPYKPSSHTFPDYRHDQAYGYAPDEPVPRASTSSSRPSRASTDSERPFEHWYRGEVSRNGGVGELRVGRREDILISSGFGDKRKAGSRYHNPATNGINSNGIPRRQRANSASSLNEGAQDRRASFYMDEHDDDFHHRESVLDEGPLTDIDQDDESSSGTREGGQRHDREYMDMDGDYGAESDLDAGPSRPRHEKSEDDGVDEDSEEYFDPLDEYYTPEPSDPSSSSGPAQAPPLSNKSRARSTTPTPSRIPRSTTPTAMQYQYSQNATTKSPALSSTSSAPSTPKVGGRQTTPGPGSSTGNKSKSPTSNSANTTPKGTPQSAARTRTQSQGARRAVSPSSVTSSPSGAGPGTAKSPSASAREKERLTAAKATREKLARQRELERDKENNRRSVAEYDLSGIDKDAIPTWTQSVPREGNWDDVVLPVVARKKGLDGHYERADGSPQQKKVEDSVEPAPGTFGFDHSKYRPPRDNGDLDEFGRQREQLLREEDEAQSKGLPQRQAQPDSPPQRMGAREDEGHDATRLPVRSQPMNMGAGMSLGGRQPPPSPGPFSQYSATPNTAPQQPQGQFEAMQMQAMGEMGGQGSGAQQKEEEDAGGGGCCKCVVM